MKLTFFKSEDIDAINRPLLIRLDDVSLPVCPEIAGCLSFDKLRMIGAAGSGRTVHVHKAGSIIQTCHTSIIAKLLHMSVVYTKTGELNLHK